MTIITEIASTRNGGLGMLKDRVTFKFFSTFLIWIFVMLYNASSVQAYSRGSNINSEPDQPASATVTITDLNAIYPINIEFDSGVIVNSFSVTKNGVTKNFSTGNKNQECLTSFPNTTTTPSFSFADSTAAGTYTINISNDIMNAPCGLDATTMSWRINYNDVQEKLSIVKNGQGTVNTSGSFNCNSVSGHCSLSCSSSSCSQTFDKNTPVVLIATPASGYSFTGWSGGCNSTSGTQCNVTMGTAKTVTANFAATQSPPPVPVNGSCGYYGNGTFSFPTTPTSNLCATGAPSAVTNIGGYEWSWDCQGLNGGNSITCFALNSTYQFIPVTVTLSGAGTGYVQGWAAPETSTDHILCGIDTNGSAPIYNSYKSCSGTYVQNQQMSLSAIPYQGDTEGVIVTWSGCDSQTDERTCVVNTGTTARSVNCNFDFTPVTNTVSFTASNGGTVTGTTSTVFTLPYNGQLSSREILEADPSTGYHFVNWTGTGGFVATATNPFSNQTLGYVTASQNITANFIINQYQATFTAGPGGSLTTTPGGSLTATIPQTVNYYGNTSAVIAVPAAGYHFVNWTGYGPPSTNNPLVLSEVTGNCNVIANFAIDQPSVNLAQLTVKKNGLGNGAITSYAGSISWDGNTGAANYYPGTLVIMSATPDPGSTFVGWSGACTGTGDCYVNMNGNKMVVANFTAPCALRPARIVNKGSFDSLQAAYDTAADGDIIQSIAQEFVETVTTNKAINVTFNGGYTCDYSSNLGTTTIVGAVNITNGSININNIFLSN
jgi:uncharacterized repeat protein (TIGR02543 family)